ALMTQMTAQVFFVSAEAKGAVLIPVSAIQTKGASAGPAAVRVVKSDGSIEPRQVRVGLVSRVSAQILEGLEPGEQIVLRQRTTAPAAAKPATGQRPAMAPRI